jgi:hypothetical protein
MATKKDLVEAYSFSRRRLVTAFLSGAPGGREVEPSRPGRTVVGGLALAVLLVAGAAIASVLASRTPEDWNKVGLVVTRGDQPATYVILEEQDPPQLIPVINITSAQLILGADVKATSVDQDVVDEQTPGIPIGILGAPQTLPRPQQFIDTGWTACTDDKVGIAVDVSNDERVARTTSDAIVVQSAGSYWLIATSSSKDRERRAYRYPISDAERDQLFVDDGLDQRAEAITVPQQWLALFPEGGEIGAGGFGVPDLGKRLTDPPVPGARVGDYVVNGDQAAMFVDGGAQPLDPFALAVLENLDLGRRTPRLLTADLPPSYLDFTYHASSWPDVALEPLESAPCAQLDVTAGSIPHVWLAGSPTGDAVSPDQGATGAIPADQRRVTIDRGHGAFVRVGSWDQADSDSRVVIDPLGRAYPLSGGPVTLDKLRYDVDSAPLVPDEWTGLFDEGVELSTSAALCPPASQPGEAQPTDDCQAAPQ